MLTRRKDKSLLLPHSEKHTADCPTRTAARFTRWRKEKNLLEKKTAYPHERIPTRTHKIKHEILQQFDFQ
nr:MAG TPA: hypothetical protein [Caudoviricetes sp.]